MKVHSVDSEQLEILLSARTCHSVTTQEPHAGGSLIISRVDEVRILRNREVKEDHTPTCESRARDLNSGRWPEKQQSQNPME